MDVSDFSGMPDYGDRKNRCATCGFYALRKPGGTSIVQEATEEARSSGTAWSQWRPYCIINAASQYREVAAGRSRQELDKTPDQEIRAQVKAVIEMERDGAHWFAWRPHFSPVWHVERRDMLQLEQSKRDFELRLKQMEMEAQRSSEQIQRDSLEIAKAVKGFTTRWTYAAFIIAAIGVVLVAASYLFPELGSQIGHRIDEWLNFPLGTAPPR